MDPALYLLWAQTNIVAGYRYSVEARPGSQSLRRRGGVDRPSPGPTMDPPPRPRSGLPATGWSIFGERRSGPCRPRSTSRPWSTTTPATRAKNPPRRRDRNRGAIDLANLDPGHYTLVASVDWQQHKTGGLTCGELSAHVPGTRRTRRLRFGYRCATLDIPRNALTSAKQ